MNPNMMGKQDQEQNPYAEIMNRPIGGGSPNGAMGGMMNNSPLPGPAMAGESPSQDTSTGNPMMEALQPGKTGDLSKPLLSAISALHAYITGSTDAQMIGVVRNIISMLTRMVAQDQANAVKNPKMAPPEMGAPTAPAQR